MSKIEYRVRAVARYVVTQHEDGRTQEIGEYVASELASGAAAALAAFRREHEDGKEAVFVPYEGPPPGKVMRFKVVMHDRRVSVASAVDADGQYLGRMIERGEGERVYKSPDPTDPANWRPDGEYIRFGAVCAGFDANGVANVEENRIFGFWSPSVNFDAVVRNEDVLRNLELGAEYYVDFIPAPKAAF
jgi:hypothetical protein